MFDEIDLDNLPSGGISFGNDGKGKVIGRGTINVTNDLSISNVYHVDGLGYNLMSVSQLCDAGFGCFFTKDGVTVFRMSDSSIAFNGRLEDKIYLVDFNNSGSSLNACLVAKTNMGWLWHRRLAHVGMRNLHKLLKGGHLLD